jgi:hypothetical protein
LRTNEPDAAAPPNIFGIMPPAAHIWVGPVFAAARRQPRGGKLDRVMHKKQC